MKVAVLVFLGCGMALAQAAPQALTPAQIAASDYHAACMDVAAIQTLGAKPLGPMLAQIAAIGSRRELAVALAAQQRTGIAAAFPSPGPAVGTLPERTDAYRGYLIRLFALLGDSPARATDEAEAAIQVGVGLAQAKQPGPHARIGLAELKQLAPNFDWTSYFNALGVPLDRAGIAASTRYLQAFNGLALLTPIESWQSYLRARWLDASSALLPPDFAAAHFAFYGRARGAGRVPPRAAFCARQQRRFTAAEYAGATLTRDSFFADTMSLRALRFATRLTRQAAAPGKTGQLNQSPL